MTSTLRIGWIIALVAMVSLVFAQPRGPAGPEVKVSSKVTSAKPGETVELELTITFGPDLHAYQNPQPNPDLIPLTIKGKGFELSEVKYPAGEMKTVGGLPDATYVYSNTITVPAKMVVPATVPAEGLQVAVGYQQCNSDTCFPPGEVTAPIILKIDGGTPVSGSPQVANPTPAEPTTDSKAPATQPKKEGLEGLIQLAISEGNWLLIGGLSLVVGLLICLTPCVYPLIPVTIGFFAGQSAHKKSSRVMLAVTYALGTAISYGLIGGLFAGSGQVFGSQFSNPAVSIGLGVLMLALVPSMFGVYEIRLPDALARQLKGRAGPVGALIMGLLMGIGAAPCAGPFLVPFAALAAGLNNVPASIAIFSIIGLGLSIPFCILALSATGAKALPKAGGWMKSVKAIMGLVVAYFGVDYIMKATTLYGKPAMGLVWAIFGLVCAVVLYLYDRKSTDARTWGVKTFGVLLAGILAGLSYASFSNVAVAKEVAWKPLTPESLAAAKSSGKPIFIDVTANWCAECQVIKRNVFEKPEFEKATEGVELLISDWSFGNDAFTQKEFGIVGLPHMVMMKPGGEVVRVMNSLHSQKEFDEALAEAKK